MGFCLKRYDSQFDEETSVGGRQMTKEFIWNQIFQINQSLNYWGKLFYWEGGIFAKIFQTHPKNITLIPTVNLNGCSLTSSASIENMGNVNADGVYTTIKSDV